MPDPLQVNSGFRVVEHEPGNILPVHEGFRGQLAPEASQDNAQGRPPEPAFTRPCSESEPPARAGEIWSDFESLEFERRCDPAYRHAGASSPVSQLKKVESLEWNISRLQAKIETLRQERQTLQEVVNGLQTEQSELLEQLKGLDKLVEAAEASWQQLGGEVQQLAERQEALRQEGSRRSERKLPAEPLAELETMKALAGELRTHQEQYGTVARLAVSLLELAQVVDEAAGLDPEDEKVLSRLEQVVYSPLPYCDLSELDDSPLFDLCVQARTVFEATQRAARGLYRDWWDLTVLPAKPEKTVFDLEQHRLAEGVAPVTTRCQALHNVVAKVLRPGFRKNGRVLRKAVVVCYRQPATTPTVSRF